MNSRLSWTFAITSLALFAFTLDRLVVAIALPAIRTDFGAQAADLEWTVNAYTLSFAVLLLTGGALGDRFGRRRMFTIGVAVFTAGSAAAALAPTIGALVAARAVQGVGGAIFTPLTLTMLAAVTPPGRRGTVLGAWGGIGGLGAALGPLAGGVLAGSVGWRAIFWLNVPLGLVLMPLARVRLAETYGPRRRLDLAGVALGSAGLCGVVWAVFGALFLITQLLQAGLRTLPMAVMPLLLARWGRGVLRAAGHRHALGRRAGGAGSGVGSGHRHPRAGRRVRGGGAGPGLRRARRLRLACGLHRRLRTRDVAGRRAGRGRPAGRRVAAARRRPQADAGPTGPYRSAGPMRQ
jgi:MFS family permease